MKPRPGQVLASTVDSTTVIVVRAPAFGSTGPYGGFRGTGQQIEAFTGGALLRQRLNQVLQHGPQPPRDLDAGATELPNLRGGEMKQ